MIKIASAIPVAFVLTLFLNAQQEPLQNLPRCPEPPEAPYRKTRSVPSIRRKRFARMLLGTLSCEL